MTLQALTPPSLDEGIASEIEQTLRTYRALRDRDELLHPRHALTADQRLRREITVMFDVTIALMIRLRLPLDGDGTLAAVLRAGEETDHDPTPWAGRCAEHIAAQLPSDATTPSPCTPLETL